MSATTEQNTDSAAGALPPSTPGSANPESDTPPSLQGEEGAESGPLPPHASRLEREAYAVSQIRRLLSAAGEGDDEALLADTIEGETEFGEAVDRILDRITDEEVVRDGAKEKAAELKARADAADQRVKDLKATLALAMVSAGLEKSFRRPLGTVSLPKAQDVLEVEDESEIPSQFFRAQPNKLDRVGLLKALKAEDGDTIPGARIVAGAPSLQIRRS